MSESSNPALRRLFRGTRPVAGVARAFARSAAGMRPLELDLEDHPLLTRAVLDGFADDLDVSPVAMALERLAAQPPGPPQRPLPRVPTTAASSSTAPGVDGPIGLQRAEMRRRTAALLAAAAPGALHPATLDDAAQATVTDGSTSPSPSTAAAQARRPRAPGLIDKAKARRVLAARAAGAGIGHALARPVARGATTQPAVAALLDQGGLEAGALRRVVAEVLGKATPKPPQTTEVEAPALRRIEELVTRIQYRRAAETETAVPEGHSSAAHVRAPREPVGVADELPAAPPRAGALTRFARRAGVLPASLDPLAGERPAHASGPGAAWPDFAPGPAATANAFTPGPFAAGDLQDLARKLSEILRDAARRHGIDTEGVET